MGRTKGGGGGTSTTTAATGPVPADVKIKDLLSELHKLCHAVQEERSRGEHNLTNIAKTHERMQQEQKIHCAQAVTRNCSYREPNKADTGSVSQYYKSKLKSLYNTAMQDAESEVELLRKSLEKIHEVKALREAGSSGRPIMRRGVLMSLLQQNALTLPLWIGKPGEVPPPLCGAICAESNYIARTGDKVAARVKGQDGEENWILAEVSSWNPASNKYEVDDIDAEEGRESHTLSKRRVVPLPVWKANPETDSEALFAKDTLVLALYPQTTCFYRALIFQPPNRPQEDYLVLFEDTSYSEGYSPPLNVAQRYVIACKEDKKK